jgi:beta-hydroxyacyl-ACP dehydratase FabZ
VSENTQAPAAGEEIKRDHRWVRSILPHRYPFLLVDRVLEIVPNKSIRAFKNFTANEEFFQGHFPDHPVVPGVLLLEALAQAGAILLLHDMEDRERSLFYFTGIDRARFRRPVVPGDQAILEVELLQRRARACRQSARVLVDGALAVEAVISSAMVNR